MFLCLRATGGKRTGLRPSPLQRGVELQEGDRVGQERSCQGTSRARDRPLLPRSIPVERDGEGPDPGSDGGPEEPDEELAGQRIRHLQMILGSTL
jgi:hypothetical protein